MIDMMRRSALEQAAAVRSGEITARELVDLALAAADVVQSTTNAFAHLDPAGARAAAGLVGPGDPRPFAGVPYAVKDLALAASGLPLTMGSRLFGGFAPAYDAAAVARARVAGFVVIGRTVSAEFGLMPVSEPRRLGPVRNPYDPSRTAGGSSGGAAAAVAGGALAIASASDAGGSIRIPAACCGLVGLKPSRGRVSLAPDLGEHFLAVEGCVARTVADSAAFLDAVAGPEIGDTTWAPPPAVGFAAAARDSSRRRIAACVAPPFAAEVHAGALAAVDAAADRLAALGHDVVRLDRSPWPADAVRGAFLDLWCAGGAAMAMLGEAVAGRSAGVGDLDPITHEFVDRGRRLPATALIAAQATLQGWGRSVVAALDAYDAILCPTLATPPVMIGAFDGLPFDEMFDRILRFTPFTPIANVTGQPAIAVPSGVDGDGLPVSVQLVGRPLGEGTILALARALLAEEPTTEEHA